jgi:RNA polymerase-binding protein DksA
VTRKNAPSRKPSKSPAKGHAKAAPRKTPAAKKAATKPAAKHSAKPAPKAAPKAAIGAAAKPAPAVGKDGKPIRKGITIVSPKPMKRPRPKPVPITMPAGMGQLFGKGNSTRKPLIPSGPHATPLRPLGMQKVGEAEAERPAHKSPFGKKDLEKFKAILLRKRAELVGDVSTMENEALKGESGSLSNLPQHIAEQGSEAYEQSLALDLAAADRKLIKEIDDALKRIEDGTYGVCELTGKPIKAERLEELPWARYSIEAARELERRSMRA